MADQRYNNNNYSNASNNSPLLNPNEDPSHKQESSYIRRFLNGFFGTSKSLADETDEKDDKRTSRTNTPSDPYKQTNTSIQSDPFNSSLSKSIPTTKSIPTSTIDLYTPQTHQQRLNIQPTTPRQSEVTPPLFRQNGNNIGSNHNINNQFKFDPSTSITPPKNNLHQLPQQFNHPHNTITDFYESDRNKSTGSLYDVFSANNNNNDSKQPQLSKSSLVSPFSPNNPILNEPIVHQVTPSSRSTLHKSHLHPLAIHDIPLNSKQKTPTNSSIVVKHDTSSTTSPISDNIHNFKPPSQLQQTEQEVTRMFSQPHHQSNQDVLTVSSKPSTSQTARQHQPNQLINTKPTTSNPSHSSLLEPPHGYVPPHDTIRNNNMNNNTKLHQDSIVTNQILDAIPNIMKVVDHAMADISEEEEEKDEKCDAVINPNIPPINMNNEQSPSSIHSHHQTKSPPPPSQSINIPGVCQNRKERRKSLHKANTTNDEISTMNDTADLASYNSNTSKSPANLHDVNHFDISPVPSHPLLKQSSQPSQVKSTNNSKSTLDRTQSYHKRHRSGNANNNNTNNKKSYSPPPFHSQHHNINNSPHFQQQLDHQDSKATNNIMPLNLMNDQIEQPTNLLDFSNNRPLLNLNLDQPDKSSAPINQHVVKNQSLTNKSPNPQQHQAPPPYHQISKQSNYDSNYNQWKPHSNPNQQSNQRQQPPNQHQHQQYSNQYQPYSNQHQQYPNENMPPQYSTQYSSNRQNNCNSRSNNNLLDVQQQHQQKSFPQQQPSQSYQRQYTNQDKQQYYQQSQSQCQGKSNQTSNHQQQHQQHQQHHNTNPQQQSPLLTSMNDNLSRFRSCTRINERSGKAENGQCFVQYNLAEVPNCTFFIKAPPPIDLSSSNQTPNQLQQQSFADSIFSTNESLQTTLMSNCQSFYTSNDQHPLIHPKQCNVKINLIPLQKQFIYHSAEFLLIKPQLTLDTLLFGYHGILSHYFKRDYDQYKSPHPSIPFPFNQQQKSNDISGQFQTISISSQFCQNGKKIIIYGKDAEINPAVTTIFCLFDYNRKPIVKTSFSEQDLYYYAQTPMLVKDNLHSYNFELDIDWY